MKRIRGKQEKKKSILCLCFGSKHIEGTKSLIIIAYTWSLL